MAGSLENIEEVLATADEICVPCTGGVAVFWIIGSIPGDIAATPALISCHDAYKLVLKTVAAVLTFSQC